MSKVAYRLLAPVRVLILPKFEIDEFAGDFPGEAQLFYEEYVAGGEVYEFDGCPETEDHIAAEDSLESVDIFETAMRNCFDAGKVLIDAILDGSL